METERVLVDTGPLIAIFESQDPHHKACREQAKLFPVGKAYTCWPVLTGAAYRLRRYPVERAKLQQAVRDGVYVLLPLGVNDIADIERVFQTYHDQDVDPAGACLVHLANREKIQHVFTLDRRDFGVYRMANGQPFKLLPN